MPPRLVVGLGDSISAGVGDAGADWIGPSWVGRFARLVDATDVVNLAVSGHRAADMRALQLPLAEAQLPDVALVSIGGNDLLRASFDPYSIAMDTSAAVSSLTSLGALVVVLGLPRPCQRSWVPGRLRRILSERVTLANSALRLGLQCGSTPGSAVFLDRWNDPRTEDRSLWHIDLMHPSPAGHEYLARAAVHAAGLGVVAGGVPVTTDDPRATSALAWLIRHGVPWLLRRTIDLIPQMLVTLIAHGRHTQRLHERLDLARRDLHDTVPPRVRAEAA